MDMETNNLKNCNIVSIVLWWEQPKSNECRN